MNILWNESGTQTNFRNQDSAVVWEDHYTSVGDIIPKMVDNERPFKDDVKFSYDTLSAKDSPTK